MYLCVIRHWRLSRSEPSLATFTNDPLSLSSVFGKSPIDTLQVLGAVAQLERSLISERTKSGIKAAKAKGRLPGNPGIRERRPEALAKMTAAQKAAYGTRLQATANQWIPIVKRMDATIPGKTLPVS